MYMKKCGDSINLILVAGVLVGLFSVYIGFTFLKYREGLTDGAYTANDEMIKKKETADNDLKTVMASLTDSPQSYIGLLNSYKNLKLATGIKELVVSKTTTQLTTTNDYDEAISYLQNMGLSNTSTADITIDNTITANNSAATLILNDLNADNQAYIDLLTSYKKLKMAKTIQTVIAPNFNITTFTVPSPSEYDDSINYLNQLSGVSMSPEAPPASTTTPNISLARK
jgi:hypothetical protein